MNANGVERWVPLTGILAALLLASVIFLPSAPDTADGGQTVLDFYVKNKTNQTIGAWLIFDGALFMVFFAASLRSFLRRSSDKNEGLAILAFGGGVGMAVGLAVLAAVMIGLVDNTTALEPVAAQALNALSDGIWLPFILGQAILFFGAGIAIVRSGSLPVWLGWIAILIGLVSMTPVGFLGFFVGLIWIVVVAILMIGRPARIDYRGDVG